MNAMRRQIIRDLQRMEATRDPNRPHEFEDSCYHVAGVQRTCRWCGHGEGEAMHSKAALRGEV